MITALPRLDMNQAASPYMSDERLGGGRTASPKPLNARIKLKVDNTMQNHGTS